MLLSDLFETETRGRTPASSLDNGIAKMIGGYLNGYGPLNSTCYGYVGNVLATNRDSIPPGTKVRFWGLKDKGLVAHGDAITPSGMVISDSPEDQYAAKGYQLVHEEPVERFLQRIKNPLG